MFNFNELRHIQLEITNNCQARCPMCPRISHGKDNPNLTLSTWTLDEYKQIITDEVINQVASIEFCGNYGDPAMNRDLLDMCKYTRSVSSRVHIVIKTNGGIRNADWWHELASTGASVVFAIDGLADTNHIYRVGTDFNKIITNASAFIKNGGSAVWDMILFAHNEHQVEQARELSKTLGFKQFSPKVTSRFIETKEGALFPVKDIDGKFQYNLRPYSKNEIKIIDTKLLEQYKKLVEECTIDCKVRTSKEIYIDSNKHIYPCVFTSKALYDVIDGDDIVAEIMKDSRNEFVELINEIGGINKLNTIHHGIKNIIDSELWQTLWLRKWENPKLIVCAKSCNKNSAKEYSDKFLNV